MGAGKMRKKIAALILMLACILMSFSGCMELERGIRVKANGDVECFSEVYMSESDMKYVYDTPEKFYDALKDNIDDEFPIESFEKIEKDVNNKKWYGARASYVIDRSDVSEELDRMFSDYDVDYRASGFLFKKVTVTIHSKGKSLTSMFSNLITKPEKELSGYINQATKNIFTIEVPYPIVSTNGAHVGSTATWDMQDLDSMTGGEITMTVSYINLPVFLVFAAVILVIIVVLVILLIRRHKKKDPSAPKDVLPPVPQELPPVAPSASESKQVPAPQVQAVPATPEEPKEELCDVPQVTGLPSIGQLPKTENKE